MKIIGQTESSWLVEMTEDELLDLSSMSQDAPSAPAIGEEYDPAEWAVTLSESSKSLVEELKCFLSRVSSDNEEE